MLLFALYLTTFLLLDLLVLVDPVINDRFRVVDVPATVVVEVGTDRESFGSGERSLGSFVQHHPHSIQGVDFNVTMKEPFAWIVAAETKYLERRGEEVCANEIMVYSRDGKMAKCRNGERYPQRLQHDGLRSINKFGIDLAELKKSKSYDFTGEITFTHFLV